MIRGKYVVGHTVHTDFESIGIEHPEDKIIDVTQWVGLLAPRYIIAWLQAKSRMKSLNVIKPRCWCPKSHFVFYDNWCNSYYFRLPVLRKALGLGAGSKPTVSLQRMTKALLCEDIQTGAHSSLEDAWATMRLFLLSLDPSKIPANVVLPPGRRRNRPFKWVAKTSNDRRTTTSNNG